MAVLQDIITYFNQWIPSEIAWDKDNTGLQIGDPKQNISKVLLCLDFTEPVLDQAIQQHFDLIISHHPFIFKPIQSINFQKPTGHLISKAIKNNISVYTAHTNLDFVLGGVSTVLAEKLGLQNITFLKPHDGFQRKIVVFVPQSHVQIVIEALSKEGAGIVGNYDSCSFQINGKGTFKGNEHSNPTVGKSLQMETVEEVRVEMQYPKWKESAILKALRNVHPYEEIAYDLYPLLNKMTTFGFGAKGELPKKTKLSDWLAFVKKALNAQQIRYSGELDQDIQSVAVCGGSCSELIGLAKSSGADCFVTADLKYHAFFESDHSFSLIDAGHYETETITLNALQQHLEKNFTSIEIKLTTVNTNPVAFY